MIAIWEDFLKQAPRNLIVVGTKGKYGQQLSWDTFRAQVFCKEVDSTLCELATFTHQYQVKL